MANMLKNMKLTSVDLVGRGANQEAHISLFKGLDSGHAEEAPKTSTTVSKSDPNRYDHIEEFP